MIFSSSASSVGGSDRKGGGFDVILTPSVFHRQIVSRQENMSRNEETSKHLTKTQEIDFSKQDSIL